MLKDIYLITVCKSACLTLGVIHIFKICECQVLCGHLSNRPCSGDRFHTKKCKSITVHTHTLM